MSGFNLRVLLENDEIRSALHNFNDNSNVGVSASAVNDLGYGSQMAEHQRSNRQPVLRNYDHHKQAGLTDKNVKLGLAVSDKQNASLQMKDGWEFMGLDEFLTETGLVDADWDNLVANDSPSMSPTYQVPMPPTNISPTHSYQFQQSPLGNIEQLLMQNNCGLSSRSASISPVQSPKQEEKTGSFVPNHPSPPVMGHASPPQQPFSPEVKAYDKMSDHSSSSSQNSDDDESVQLASPKIVKKRKYSEDGEGLTDTSVVVVPGQKGFNPSEAKFAPEDLQPQPIIKKSRKQFVPDDNKDEKYWKRRNKNNVAAKRSREARRAKENQIIMRAGFLEGENDKLKQEVARLNSQSTQQAAEIDQLKQMVKRLKQQIPSMAIGS